MTLRSLHNSLFLVLFLLHLSHAQVYVFTGNVTFTPNDMSCELSLISQLNGITILPVESPAGVEFQFFVAPGAYEIQASCETAIMFGTAATGIVVNVNANLLNQTYYIRLSKLTVKSADAITAEPVTYIFSASMKSKGNLCAIQMTSNSGGIAEAYVFPGTYFGIALKPQLVEKYGQLVGFSASNFNASTNSAQYMLYPAVNVTGTITTSSNQLPISEAILYASSRDAPEVKIEILSDIDGNFQVMLPGGRNFVLTASFDLMNDNFVTEKKIQTLQTPENGGELHLNITVYDILWKGRIVNAIGDAIPQASFVAATQVSPDYEKSEFSLTSNSEGYIQAWIVPGYFNSIYIDPFSSQYSVTPIPAQYLGPNNTNVDFVVQNFILVSGYVTYANGLLLSYDSFISTTLPLSTPVSIDSTGYYQIGICEGTFNFTVAVDSIIYELGAVKITNETSTINWQITPVIITGVVQYASGKTPVLNAAIEGYECDCDPFTRECTSFSWLGDSNGNFVGEIAPGNYCMITAYIHPGGVPFQVAAPVANQSWFQSQSVIFVV